MAVFPLDDQYEIYLGAALGWVDITERVFTRDDVTITYGRADEASRPDPAELSLTLNNRDGVFSPRNPRSPYFGLLGRNTPIRVTVPGPTSHLDLQGDRFGRAVTPSSTALDVAGDLDVRWDMQWAGSGPGGVVGRWHNGVGGWWIERFADGFAFHWMETGGSAYVVSFSPLGVVLPDRVCFRLTLQADGGGGAYVVSIYWANSIDGPWTLITDRAGSHIASIALADVDLGIGVPYAESTGYTAMTGWLYRVQVRNGVGGTVVADADFTTVPEGATTFTDEVGNPFTVTAPAQVVADRNTRFAGEVSYWPQRWDVSGRDVYTPIKAAGILRRLGQGSKPLQSALRRAIPQGHPIAYWPMEDGKDARSPVSATEGVDQPRIETSVDTGNKVGLTFAADDSLVSSDALPTLDPKVYTTLRFAVPTAGVTEGSWHVELVYRLPTVFRGLNTVLQVYTNGGGFNRISVNFQERVNTTSPSIRVQGDDRYSDPVDTTLIDQLVDYSGQWNRLQLTATTSGSNVNLQCRLINIGGGSYTWSTTYAGTVGRIDRIDIPWGAPYSSDVPALSVGHLGAFPQETFIYNNADIGYLGETAVDRLTRLAGEESIPMTILGDPVTSEAMGPQDIDTALTLLDEAVDADGGMLGEQRDAIGLTYRPRSTLYNLPPTLALDYAARGEVMPPLEPVDDDQATRNDVTVQRRNGSGARLTLDEGPLSTQAPPAGVGVYDESVPLNLASDDQTEPIAGWRLHLGTWDEARYPTVHLALHAAPWLIPAFLQMQPGDVLTIANPPDWLPPGLIRLRVEGYTETIASSFEWTADLNCSPAGPWTVATVTDEGAGTPDAPDRVDTDGSELDSPAAVGDTQIAVTVTAGPLWTGDPAQMPFDIRVGGEVMRVTAVTPDVLPQTFTVERGLNGIELDHPAGADVRLAYPAIVAL